MSFKPNQLHEPVPETADTLLDRMVADTVEAGTPASFIGDLPPPGWIASAPAYERPDGLTVIPCCKR